MGTPDWYDNLPDREVHLKNVFPLVKRGVKREWGTLLAVFLVPDRVPRRGLVIYSQGNHTIALSYK